MPGIIQTQQIPVTDVIRQIITIQRIRRMQLLSFRLIVKVVIQKMPGLLPHLIMMHSIFQFTAGNIGEDGILAPNVIQTPRIMPFSLVLHHHAMAMRITRIREAPGAMHVIQEVQEMINKLNSIFLFSFFLFSFIINAAGQEQKNVLEGTVSYLTGTSIYVKFESTHGIENGDTLYRVENEKLIPELIVQNHSSISCLCNAIGDNQFQLEDRVFAKIKKQVQVASPPEIQKNNAEQDINEQALKSSAATTEKGFKQEVSGRISVSSYSNFNNGLSDDTHQFRYTFSMDASHISSSRFSAETYINFTHKLHYWDEVKNNLNSALKIYSLALKYDIGSGASIYAGRKINAKIANVGAVDGLQFQKDWNRVYIGAVAGTRPDYEDYGFNPNLFEYGAYVGHNQKVKNGFIQTSLAFFEQRNHSNIDRRFVYFQHNNSIIKNLNLFTTFEVDLYKVENGQPSNTFSLTGLYISLNYRLKKVSLFGSYDNRKNVIYYETFKNYADALLQQASRQGLRFRVNYRPVKFVFVAVNAGTRFMKQDRQPTRTLNGTATYSRVPKLNASLTLSANLMQTAYLNGQYYGARLSRDIIPGKLNGMIYYRWVKFDYSNTVSTLVQNIGEIDLSWQFNKKMYLSVNYESTFQKNEKFNRLYIQLSKRF